MPSTDVSQKYKDNGTVSKVDVLGPWSEQILPERAGGIGKRVPLYFGLGIFGMLTQRSLTIGIQ